MPLENQPSRPPPKGAAHYRHTKAAQQRGADETDVRATRRHLLAAHQAKRAAKRGAGAETRPDAPPPAVADEPV